MAVFTCAALSCIKAEKPKQEYLLYTGNAKDQKARSRPDVVIEIQAPLSHGLTLQCTSRLTAAKVKYCISLAGLA